MKIYQIF